MNDMQVSAVGTMAAILWAAAFTLVFVNLFTDVELGQLGLLLAGVAMVLNVRSFLYVIHQREKAAFELGAESVRPLHPQKR